MNIEAEGGELILKNSAGDHVIIPKNKRDEVKLMLKSKAHSSIDKLVNTLPVMDDYAEDGTVVPKEEYTPPPLTETAVADNTRVDVKVPMEPDKKMKNFEVRIQDPKQKSIDNGDGTKSTHKMMSFEADDKYYAAPTIVEINGNLKELSPEGAIDYALKNNEYKEFKTQEEASKYAEGDYKKGTPMDTDKKNIHEYQPGDIKSKPPPRYSDKPEEVDKEFNRDNLDEAKAYIKDYHNSPKYKERYINQLINYTHGDKKNKEETEMLENLKKANDSNASESDREFYKSLADINKIGIDGIKNIAESKYEETLTEINSLLDNSKTKLFSGESGPMSKNMFGSNYDPEENKVTIFKDQLKDEGANPNLISAHEYSHNTFGKHLINYIHPDQAKAILSKLKTDDKLSEHDMDEYETKADIDAIRYNLKKENIYDAGTEDFTKKHLEKLKKSNTYTAKRLQRLYSDETIIWLMNTLASQYEKNQDNLA